MRDEPKRPLGEGDFTYEKDGDACRLTKWGIFQILVSLRVFWRELHYIWPMCSRKFLLRVSHEKIFHN